MEMRYQYKYITSIPMIAQHFIESIGQKCYTKSMNSLKNLKIPGLYRIKKSDREKVIRTYLSAFQKYPKLMNAFPKQRERLFALEATIRYYCAYDLHYGAGFSLDDEVNEAVLLIHSDQMNYSLPKHIISGSYSREYRKVMKLLTPADRHKRTELFDELDALEKNVEIPSPHLYLDFLGTKQKYQGQGRGRKMMKKICGYADSINLPIMLFTNTEADVAFYQSLGFHIIGETASEKFGFTNTYLLYEPQI